jgi:DNA-binding IclR family transcriptional regulator
MVIEVVEKTFAVLERMVRLGRPVTLGELAAEVRLPKPTLYRILRTLRDLGYVEQQESGEYAMTSRLAAIASNDRHASLSQVARPLMQRLHSEFDETVNLGVLEGSFVSYVEVLETTRALRWIVKPGVRDTFHTTALGRAIAANLPEKHRARLVAKVDFSQSTGKRVKSRAALNRTLDEARERGWALEEEETVAGVACLAFSLRTWGEPTAAISVAIPIHRYDDRRRTAIVNAFEAILADAPKLAANA